MRERDNDKTHCSVLTPTQKPNHIINGRVPRGRACQCAFIGVTPAWIRTSCSNQADRLPVVDTRVISDICLYVLYIQKKGNSVQKIKESMKLSIRIWNTYFRQA